jgi:hypothetical protein
MTYGGLLLVILTSIFWYWSGMASLGCLFLVAPAPILMLIIAYKNYKLRSISLYHRLVYMFGMVYPFVIGLCLLSVWLYKSIS